jgi:hypothetical protein
VNGKIKPKNHSKDASRSYINPGREFLAELGAWPWAVAREARGRLPRHWHRERAFTDAFAAWHRRSWFWLLESLEGSTLFPTRRESPWRRRGDLWHAGRAYYDAFSAPAVTPHGSETP